MNDEELAVVMKLAEAWDLFVKLPKQHHWEPTEFMQAIHAAQMIVMARPTARRHSWIDLEYRNGQ